MAKNKRDKKAKTKGSKRGRSASAATAGREKSSAKRKNKKQEKRKRKPSFTAETADKHELYQFSVQSPEEDTRFLRRVYKSIRGKKAGHLREDFCGTALLASHWVKKGPEFTAEGFDIDADTVAWGVEHNFEPIGDAAARCKLHVKDVREPSHQPPDVRCALNFSYCIFHTREEVVDYFRAAHADLAADGVFVIDIHGGPDSMEETEEEREIEEGFTYIWDQDRFWPATGEYRCYIHFEFKDGTRIERAFRYDWRLWNITEIVDCMRDAGFEDVQSYWEGTDEDGESGDGNFRRKRRGENCESWIAYVVGTK